MILEKAFLFSVALASIVTPPKRRHGLKLDFEVVQVESDKTLKRSGFIKRADGSELLEVDQTNFYYQAVVYMGSNRDKCIVVLDTGSSDLWVMGNNSTCEVDVSKEKRSEFEPIYERKVVANALDDVFGATSTGNPYLRVGASECTAFGSFNTASSDTFKKNDTYPDFSIIYMDQSYARGVYGSDTVGFSNDLQVNMTFGVVNDTSTNMGTFGIGPILEEASSVRPPYVTYDNFPVQLKKSGMIEKVAYSLFLNKKGSGKGSVLFGAVDHKKYTGQLQTVPFVNLYRNLIRYDSFAIRLNQIYFANDTQNVTILDQPMGVILDSGTSLQALPRPVIQALVSSMQGNYSEEEGFYQVECAYNHASGHLVYDFSGIQIKVPVSELLTENEGLCYLGVLALDQSSATFANGFLGDTFLRSAYVVYDLEAQKISLAQANYTDEENVEVISGSVPSAVKAAGYSSTSLSVSLSEESTSQFDLWTSKNSAGDKRAVSIAFVLTIMVLGLCIN